MEAATIETKASNDQAWNAVNHSFYLVVEVSISSLSLSFSPMYVDLCSLLWVHCCCHHSLFALLHTF